jgi:fructose-specific phosphotransferase system IIC component
MATPQEVQPAAPETYEEYVPQEDYASAEEITQQPQEQEKPDSNGNGHDRSGFINGLSVGLGIGCIATFVITWISLFFTPQMPATITYETLLAVFIYPLIYLLAVGLIALTAGVVREYYSLSRR